MNAARLLALYEQVAEAPNAIGCLRRFVRDLAVRGKLVAQDPRDEPASELLKRIAAEKTQLIKAGNIKTPKAYELPSGVAAVAPDGWKIVPLGNVINNHMGGGTPSKNNHAYWDGDIRWASVKDVGKSKFIDDTVDRITAEGLVNSSSNLIPPGNLIVVTRMGLGQLSINRVPVAINQDLRALFLSSQLEIDFVYNFFLTHSLEGTGLTVKGIKLDELMTIPFPLAPLAEQRRIVAKVEELMALLDRLEAARIAREAARDRLTAASLTRLTAPETEPEAFSVHARFALGAFPALTTRPDQIKSLRQTILNLAVRGKLVEQAPADEPASELLKRVHRERKYRRKFAEIDVKGLDIPLPDLPSGWFWATIDQTCADDRTAITDGPFGSQLKTAHYISAPGYRVIRLQNIGSGVFREEHRSYIERSHFERLSKHHVNGGDLVVAGLVDPTVRCCEVPINIGPALVKADCYRLVVHPEICSRFVLCVLNSPLAQEFAVIYHHGMTLTRIGLGNFRRIPIPLAPLAEQHRIVAKVDELMALCDRLEVVLATADTTKQRLLEGLLREALAPAATPLETEVA